MDQAIEELERGDLDDGGEDSSGGDDL